MKWLIQNVDIHFSIICWQHYLTYKILQEGIEKTILRPAKCDILIDDKTAKNYGINATTDELD